MTITVWPADAVAGAPIYSGRKLRQTNAVSLAGATAARPLGARSGVRAGTPTTTVTATATTWTVKPHAGVLDLEAAAESGPYNYATDANVTGTVTAASVVRTDLAWVRIDDPAEGDGSSTPGAVFGYTAGTSTTPPATPARSMVLAWINVPASGGGAPTVTWKAPYLAAGIVPGTTAAEFGSGAFIGQAIDDPALGLLRWSGTAWKQVTDSATPWVPAALASGWANLSGHPAQYRVVGDECEVRGSAQYGGLTAGAPVNMLTGLPAEVSSALASHPLFAAGATNGTIYAPVMVNVRTDGIARAIAQSTMTGNVQVTLDGMKYRIS